MIAPEFFNKILDLNAGKSFKEILFGVGGIGSYFKRNIPEGMTRREWLKRFNETIKKFRLAERCGWGLDVNSKKTDKPGLAELASRNPWMFGTDIESYPPCGEQ